MIRYIAWRIVMLVPTVLGMTVVVFLTLHASGADPAIALAGNDVSPDILSVIRQKLGLDLPLHVRFLAWVWALARGDFGVSLIDSRPVLATILQTMPATLLLVVGAVGVALAIGLPAGLLAALRRHSALDHASRLFALFGVSVPSFWLGLMLVLVFAYYWRVLPVAGYGGLRYLVLPSITLGTAMAALLMRLTRANMLEVLREDYIRTARAKGVPLAHLLAKHALRNALLPIVTALGLEVGILLGGTVVVETIFSWPGVGRLAYIRMLQRDFPMVMGALFVYALLFGLVTLLTDISYAFLDPRVRYE